ncbi:MAG: diheme cytochrome c-553 [Chitinophagaceae bacterium]
MSHEEMVALGKYIITTGGCDDCHSPKIMTQQGLMPDTTKRFSGSPQGMQLPPIDSKSLQPGNWISLSSDITAFVGPWGISYAVNLTPDSATGIGAWSEENFIKALRTGKHLGQENGRPILPPMPWHGIGQKNDQDLKAMFAYLKSLPPIKNQVPSPVAPPDVGRMIKGK